VQFVLEPLYKIIAHAVGTDANELQENILRKIGVKVKKQELYLNIKPLFQKIFTELFGSCTGFVDAIVKHIPAPTQGSGIKLERHYTGPLDSDAA
jgi:116 kDa U5 small nuclear ribonucleoprotein component